MKTPTPINPDINSLREDFLGFSTPASQQPVVKTEEIPETEDGQVDLNLLRDLVRAKEE